MGQRRKTGRLEYLDLEKPISRWKRAICPICHREYLHSRFFKPRTCLQKECIQKFALLNIENHKKGGIKE